MDSSRPQDILAAAALFNTHAAAYLEKYGDISRYHPLLNRFAEKTGRKILDVACGPGLQLQYLRLLNPSFQLTGIDLAPEMVRLAKELVPEADLRVMDCRELPMLPGPYDGILVSFLLPYLDRHETEKLIGDISALLKPGGRIYLGFISGAYKNSGAVQSSGGETVMRYFYEEETITNLLTAAGIRTIHREELASPDPRQTQQDMILIGHR